MGPRPSIPLTTDPDIRAATRRIRTHIASCPGEVLGPEAVSVSLHPDPLCQALSRLLKAMSDHDDAAVRRQAFAARAAVRGTPSS